MSLFCESHFAITSKHVEEKVGTIKQIPEINKTSEICGAELLVLEICQMNEPFPLNISEEEIHYCQRMCFSVLFVVTGADVVC